MAKVTHMSKSKAAQAAFGLIMRAPTTTMVASAASTRARPSPAAARPAAPAQPIEANASAKVAVRDDVWRRRKWLRLAWERKKNWIAVAEPAAARMPAAVIAAVGADTHARAPRIGDSTSATAISTASTFA